LNTATKILSWIALCCAVSGPAAAQQPASPAPGNAAAPAVKPAQPTAQSEAGDPRADSSSPAVEAPPPAAAAPPGGRTPAAGRTTSQPKPGNPEPKPGQKSAPRTDRLDLGTATVTGDREQPKVMYIVPWKRSDIGDLAGKPMNSLVDEILAPVDRDVFKREVVYYHAVQADASQNGASPKPAQQGEK
jgi:hypothetical protein